MSKKDIYLDEEGNLREDLSTTVYNIGYSKKPTRKIIKEDAIKLANTDGGEFATSKDYLQGNVIINTNKRKQRLFNRIFNKEYNKRISKTIDNNLLEAAKEGDTEALGKYIIKNNNEVAPYFIPAVASPAAMYAASSGLFSMAGFGAAKGLHTIGNAMMPSTYIKALNIGSKYPLLPTTLDALANSAYIGGGLNHAKKLYNNGEYEAAVATGLLSGLPLAHTVLNGAKSLTFNTKLPNISKNNIKLTKAYNKYLKPFINTKKAKNDLYNRYRSAMDANSDMEIADLRKYNEFNDALSKSLLDNTVIKVPITKIKQPSNETINIISHDTNLPIKGVNRKITTTNIEEIASPEDFEILDPNSKLKSMITTLDLGTGFKPIQIVRGLKQSNNKYLLRAGNPSADEIQAFDEYRKAISETIGSDGAITGSTRLYGKYLSGEPNDLEILTTRSKLNNLQHKLNFSKKQELPLAIEGRSIIDNSQIKTDIQIIDDYNGFATGDIANSIYTVLHPEKLAEIHKAKAGFNKIFYPKSDGTYYTADEMLNEVMSKDLLDKVILVDALKVSKNYNINPVKQNRPVTLLSNDNPNTIKDIKDALKILGEAQVGKEYKSFNQLYNVDFTNISANKEFLKAIGFPEKLATNPEIMKNIAEYYHMQKSLTVRNINSARAGNNLDDAITTTTSRSGTGSGGGGNSVNATHAKVVTSYGDISTISQYDIVPDKSKVKTLYDYYKQVKRLDRYTDLTPDQINKINANPNYAGKTYKKVKDVHERSGYINTPDNAEFVANELDLPVIFYPNEGGVSNYVGRYSKKPLTYTSKSSKSALYEFGRPIEEYYSTNNNTKIRLTYHDAKEQEFAEKISKLLNSKDKQALKQLGVEVYNEEELNNLFNMINDRYNKNYKILNNIYRKNLDKLNKISDIKKGLSNGLLYGTGISATTALGIHFLTPALEEQRQQDVKNLNYLYDLYKKYYESSKNENVTEIYKENLEKLKNSVSKRVWRSFEKRYKEENNTTKKEMGGKQKQNNLLQVKNGIAQPLGNNYFLMRGPKHEQGGIDIGKNLEVEGGEIVKLNPKSIKVLSNAKIMGDMTPSEYALGGIQNGTFEDRFNKGFKYQEKFKDVNGLNDDGTNARMGKNKELGGKSQMKQIKRNVSSTGKKIKADVGTKFIMPKNNGTFTKVADFESAFNRWYPPVELNVPKINISENNNKNNSNDSNRTLINSAPDVNKLVDELSKDVMGMNFDDDFDDINVNPIDLSETKLGYTPQTISSKPKTRLLNAGDWVNIGANSLGAITNLVTGLTSPDIRYARMRDAIPVMAPKINSNVNTTAEESAIDEAYNAEAKAINSNTSNSQVVLNRLRNANARRASAKVKVRSAAENTRRDLINTGNILAGEYQKYNIGRQEQVDAYNRQAEAAEFNANKDKVGNAISGFVGDIMQGASTITNAVEQRNADRINTVLSFMGNPNVNVEGFSEAFAKIYEQIYGRQPSRYMLRKFNK